MDFGVDLNSIHVTSLHYSAQTPQAAVCLSLSGTAATSGEVRLNPCF
jgi:hypothetical protein